MSTIPTTNSTRNEKSANHQYSDRRARPLKSMYFLVSTVCTASWNDTLLLLG